MLQCALARCSSQVLAVNTGLVAATAIVAALLAPDGTQDVASAQRLLLIGLAVVSAVLLNSLLLRRRLRPLDAPAARRWSASTSPPRPACRAPPGAPREVERLTADFNRMLVAPRGGAREAGRAVIRAQEEERARIAQDLHDEVNQALTAILLRLQAAMLDVPPGLRSRAQGDPDARHAGDGGTAQARPHAAPDRARRPRPRPGAGLRRSPTSASARASARASTATATPPSCPTRSSSCSTASPRRASPTSSSTPARAPCASSCPPSVAPCCACATTAAASGRTASARNRLGVSGMRERALLVGGRLNVFSAPGEGTTIELTMGAS